MTTTQSNSDQKIVERDVDLERRGFIGVTSLTALGLIGGGITAFSPDTAVASEAKAAGFGGSPFDEAFKQKTYDIRVKAAETDRAARIPVSVTNGDEERYPNRIGSDTRALPHNQRGEVDENAYRLALKAYASGDPADYEKIPLGGTRKQLNPIGSLAVSLTGGNAAQFAVPPAPTLASSERAVEAIEVYWHSLLRDVPLSEFRNDTSNADILAAVDELNKHAAYNGPKENGRVTPQTLFRGSALYRNADGKIGRYVTPPGADAGPYISQFLLRDGVYGSQAVTAKIRTAVAGEDFLTDYDEWLRIQNGVAPSKPTKFDGTLRYITTGRDLAEYAHIIPAGFLAASLILGTAANKTDPAFGGIGASLNPSNPYLKSKTQSGASSTFGTLYFQGLLALASSRSIRVAYWQKFFIHRTVRPEAYGGLIHHRIVNKVDDYPVHADILNSKALDRARAKFGTHLLSHSYPEASPIHSSYPGGAAIIGSANVTLLKAFFNEEFTFPNPVQADPKDPTKLIPYQGAPLTVGGELNKLALNYGLGRNWSGIHWRSDLAASLALGEDLAIALLRDERATFREAFDGFTFTKFDGTKITV